MTAAKPSRQIGEQPRCLVWGRGKGARGGELSIVRTDPFRHWLGELPGAMCVGVDGFMRHCVERSNPPVVGLLTGNVRVGAEIKLRHFGLWEQFALGAFGDDHEDRNELAAIAWARGRKGVIKGSGHKGVRS